MSVLDWFRRKPTADIFDLMRDATETESRKGKRLVEVLDEMANHGNLQSIQAGCVFWLQQNFREASADFTTLHLLAQNAQEHGTQKAVDRLLGMAAILEKLRADQEELSNSIGDSPAHGRTGDKAQAVCTMHAAGIWRYTLLTRVSIYTPPDESLVQLWTRLLRFGLDDLMRWEPLVNGKFGLPRTERPRFEDWGAMRAVTGREG